MKKIKLIILILIFIIGIAFLWQYLNHYLTKSKADTDIVTIGFTSNSIEFNQNNEKTTGLTLEASNSEKISGIDLKFNFDSNNDLLDFIDYQTTPQNYFTDEIIKEVKRVDNGKLLRLVLVAKKNNTELSSSLILNLRFKSKKITGQGEINIGNENQIVGTANGYAFQIVRQNNSVIYKISTEANCSTNSDCSDNSSCNNLRCNCINGFYNCDGNWVNGCESNTICSPTNTPPPGATNTPPPGATNTPPPGATNTPPPGATNLTLNLTLRFQGIVDNCPSSDKKIKTRIKLAGRTNTGYKIADFSCNQGKWTGSVSFNAPAGSGYIVYVKGEKHLQKKICHREPKESQLGPGTYTCTNGQITLNSGTNNLDFSGVLNLYGDLPVGGEQDGVINSLDSSYIRNNLGETDPEVLAVCDGNLDGKCDTQDWSLLIMALSIKGDEI